MARTLYTLLVGIDNYPEPIPPLCGCANDVRRMQTLLQVRGAELNMGLEQVVLLDGDATRAAVIDGFRTHLAQAGPDDTVLFYYSGHGSQEFAPPEFWPAEPDHLDETLVCFDSRQPDQWDLADKELAQLLGEVAAGGAHVAVILDCCHSGSGTRGERDPEDGQVRVRRAPADQRVRPPASFLVGPAQAGASSPGSRVADARRASDWYSLPGGRHVLLAACRADEEAKELYLGSEQRGAFSYYLLRALEQPGLSPTYRDIFKQLNAQVRTRVAGQTPQMEASVLADLDQPFLGGVIQGGPRAFTISYAPPRGWVVDAGAVHGLPSPQGAETAWLAVFPLGTASTDLAGLAQSIGMAQVTEVFPAQSKISLALNTGQPLETGATYKAVIVSLPLPPLAVALRGDPAALDLVRTAMEHSGPGGSRSMLVQEGAPATAALLLHAVNGRYEISRQGDRRALTAGARGVSAEQAKLAVLRLEHIARWVKIVELRNPGSLIPADAVRMEVMQPGEHGDWQPAAAERGVELAYHRDQDGWRQPCFSVRLVNTGRRRLFCLLLDLPETFGVFPLLKGSGGLWLEPGQEAWANDGAPLYAEIPDSLWQAGMFAFKDTLKLIVSTEECDATLLAQDDLPTSTAPAPGQARRAVPRNTLARLMERVGVRHLSAQPSATDAIADWTAAEVGFTIYRPPSAAVAAQALQQSG